MTWINIKQNYITSLLLWDHNYEPHQTIIFRHNHNNHLQLFFYFKTTSQVLAFQDTISEFRTETEQERMFQIARMALLKLEALLIEEQNNDSHPHFLKPIRPELNKLFDEAFLSSYGIALMRERAPDFGFYSLSPNIKKIEKMLLDKPYSIIDHLRHYNLIK